MAKPSYFTSGRNAFQRLFVKLMASLLLVLSVTAPSAAATVSPGCRIGYSFNFFSGVGNTWLDARGSALALRQAYGESYKGEHVRYQNFYNTTQGLLTDVGETFVQRGLELDPSGNLSYGNLFMYWTWLDGKFDPSTTGYSNMQVSPIPGVRALSESVVNTLVARLVVIASLELTATPTADNIALHRQKLDVDDSDGRKLLLLAHSQGNLFVNNAFDYIGPKIGTNLVKVVHVAPASPTLRGKYILSSNDLVINGLRAANGANSVPDNNIDLPMTPADLTGHGLVEIYLNPALAARKFLNGLVNDNLVALSSPQGECPMTLTPSSATYVKPGATIELAAKLESQPPDDNSKITYKWSVSGNASGLLLNPVDGTRSTSFETTSKTVTYVASTNALNSLKDTVSVTAIYTSRIDSSVTRAFSAPTTSTLTVSGGQVVLDGRFDVIGWARTDRFAFAGLYQVNAYVVVPFVKDAKSYVVRGFNFNDPSFYGTSLTRSFSGQQVANLPVWDLSFGITPSGSNFTMPDVSRVGNEVYISIAGSGGDSSTEGQYRARFSGMQVEVTVQLP